MNIIGSTRHVCDLSRFLRHIFMSSIENSGVVDIFYVCAWGGEEVCRKRPIKLEGTPGGGSTIADSV